MRISIIQKFEYYFSYYFYFEKVTKSTKGAAD